MGTLEHYKIQREGNNPQTPLTPVKWTNKEDSPEKDNLGFRNTSKENTAI